MFTQLPFRIVAVLFVSILVGALSVRVATRPADMFFLDWRQILANGKAPKVPIKVIDISGTDAKSKDRERVDNAKLAEVLENISRHKPRAIFLTLSKNEIQIEMNSVEWRRLLSIENLYLLTDRVSQAGAQGLNTHPVLKDFPRLLYFETTWDTKIDNVSRRIILYYDTKKSESHMSQIFKMTRDYAGNSFPPEYFKKSFEYVGTEQIYLKIWPDEKFDEVKLDPKTLTAENMNAIEGNVVLVDSYDLYSMNAGRAISYRTSFRTGENFEDNHWSNARVVATFMTNLYSGEYVRQPSDVENAFWISFWVAILILSAWLLKPPVAFVMGFLWIFIFSIISVVLFRLTSFNFDMTRVLFASFLLQYVGIPLRLIRHLRQQDRREIERVAEANAQKAEARLLVKAATSDMQMRVVAQVSHDIRSPLMALQIAHRVIKDGISQEAGELIQGSIERLKYIAEDTLQKFRNESSQQEAEINLSEALSDLVTTFKALYSNVEFRLNVAKDVRLLWPSHSLARTFTNLFNNSIEAFGPVNEGLIIAVSLESQEDRYTIRIQDNGPGIPENILPKLFQSGATFGKVSGTGLGLYQVRKDLEDFGGRVHALKSSNGAIFEITLPRYLETIEVQVTKKVLVVSEVDLPLHNSRGVEITRVGSLREAKEFLKMSGDLSVLTVVMDLVFSDDEGTAFDLIESLDGQKPFKTFVCTSLGENEEIRKLSDKYDVLLVTRSLLSRFALKS